ncbi:fibronectin type III domain-containing protein [Colletotrichum tabaci]|uniref:Fibronectin type III domain-containing protein n=1 Tax=Colletotrichum tabaci TaxID=1209068 RepID=A0AAV9T6F0_9PEZI
MLWTLFMKIILISSLVAWWLKRPNSRFQKFVLLAATLAAFWVVAPLYASLCLAWSVHYTREGIRYWNLDELLVRHASMLVTLAAVIWLLHRAWQTLWKPTTDLISILGVDVPEAPDVSLAGIRPDAATLNWTRPTHNRPVQKFLIQVNGVNVGESRQEETAITVTGLRPNHCYNIRVIAVGPNNFQAGSQVIRLRTYRSDGRPELGNSRLPDSFQEQDQKSGQFPCVEDNAGRNQVPTIEAAPSLESGSAAARDGPSSQRRNTVNRRHSPSIASQEQPSIKDFASDHPEASLKDLADTLERTRKEIDETAALHASEESEFKQLEERLKKEKEEKKKMQKEKDDNTAQLRQKVKATYEQMRQATKDKARKENLLKERQDKRKKISDNVDKWTTEIENMRKTRKGFASEKESLEQDRDLKVKHLDEDNSALQEEYSQLEAEYKEKKEQLKELEDARRKLPGGEEDDTWREDDRKMKRDFEMKRRELQSQLIMENRKAQQLEGHIHVLHAQVYAQNQQSLQLYNQANSSGVDFEQNASAQVKRRSRTGNTLSNAAISSPTGPFPASDSPFEPPTSFSNRSGFSHFLDISGGDGFGADQFSDTDLRALPGNAPLSPTAAALLPSGILGDDESASPDSFSRRSPFVPEDEYDAQSPQSSKPSNSAQSSPPGSSHKTAFPPFPSFPKDEGDHASLNDVASSPSGQPPPAAHRFTSLLSSFQRGKGAKAVDEGGIGGLFRSKDKESDSGKDKDKSKSKDKAKDRAKDKEAKEKGKTREFSTPSLDLPQGYDASPTDSRKSRDAFSVHTQASVTESRESLTLDRAVSSTLSDSNAKDQENAYRKLFRKGSSSKFSLSSRLSKDSGLFKKGPGSTTNSDKNLSADRSSFGDIDDYGEEGLLGRSYESVTSSPSLGPSKSKETKESRMTNWSSKFSMKKKGNKESVDLHRATLEADDEEDKKDV